MNQIQKQESQLSPETRVQRYEAPQILASENTEANIDTPPLAPEGDGFLEDAISGLKQKIRKPKKHIPAQVPHVRDELTVQVEKIMEEGLGDAYQALTTVQKQEFKIKGEHTAIEIRTLLRAGKVKIKKIFMLLLEWLKILPGINRFFLEQEAKIKADKIITLKDMSR